MKYIEENKLKNRNNESENLNNNLVNYNNKNYSPIDGYNKNNINKNSIALNKGANILKNEKGRNRSTKGNNNHINKNDVKFYIEEKEKDKNNNSINDCKIDDLNSSYNNNFTNIKTNKIVFIGMKNNNNLLNNEANNNNDGNKNKVPKNKNLKNIKSNFNNSHQLTFNKNMNNINNINNIIKTTFNLEENKYSKFKEEFNKNNKFSNLIVQKVSKPNTSINNCSILIDKLNNKRNEYIKELNREEVTKLKNDNNLSQKECSYYILSKSPILRLCEKMIFSRSTSKLRNILPKEIIFKEHKIILENKIVELKQKVALCNKNLEKSFIASKTADIALNFITSLHEIEFKNFPILMSNDEEKNYYVNYIKILYHLLNEEIANENEEPDMSDKNNAIFLRKDLYLKINKKGYKSIRDYLYNIYIKNKNTIKEIQKIEEINYLVSQVNNMFDIHNSMKICKFISFTMYLINEIINFGNNIKSTIELKIKAKNLIDIFEKKLEKFENDYKNK